MKKILITIAIHFLKFLANIIYLFIKLFPTKHQIVMISRQSNNITLDFRLIQNELNEKYGNLKVVVLCKKIENGIKNKILYCMYILKTMYYLATSKLCIIDGYCIPVSILKHKKNLTVIQIWHASGAVKKFGYQILDKKEGTSSWIAKLMCMHKNYDYLIAPSEITKDIFSKAFNVSKEKIIKLGLPRLEYIVNPMYDKSNEIYKQYPHLKDKKNIVYIPTFRKNNNINLVDNVIKTKIDKNKYNLIISLHPLDKTEVPKEYLIDKKYSSFDLIKIADYIITDYSVLSIEASVLGKPIFLLLEDLQEYKNNRGLNIDFTKELPSFVCEKFVEIMDKINKKEYNMKELYNYRNKYIEIDINNALDKLLEFIVNKEKS